MALAAFIPLHGQQDFTVWTAVVDKAEPGRHCVSYKHPVKSAQVVRRWTSLRFDDSEIALCFLGLVYFHLFYCSLAQSALGWIFIRNQ